MLHRKAANVCEIDQRAKSSCLNLFTEPEGCLGLALYVQSEVIRWEWDHLIRPTRACRDFNQAKILGLFTPYFTCGSRVQSPLLNPLPTCIALVNLSYHQPLLSSGRHLILARISDPMSSTSTSVKSGWSCHLHGDHVAIQGPDFAQKLKISFQRTVKVPDTKKIYDLPPTLGTFPLYEVKDHAFKLPKEMAEKGGILMPMYRKSFIAAISGICTNSHTENEAMWIDFTADAPFAIKIFMGGINAVSGREAGSLADSKSLTRVNKSKLQDYIVVPRQDWLDGIACGDGYVKQFVATRMGDGFSVEAQLTGEEVMGGIQFEVTPEDLPSDSSGQENMQVFLKSLTGKTTALVICAGTRICEIKTLYQIKEGIPPDQLRLTFHGKHLMDGITAGAYDISDGDTLRIHLRLRGGGDQPMPMAIAAGGRIDQVIHRDFFPPKTWDKQNTVVFNVQILNTKAFEAITGKEASATPISAKTYRELGYPFFKMYEEKSQVSGDFSGVKSMAEIEGIPEEDLVFTKQDISITPSSQAGPGSSYTMSERGNAEMSEVDPDDEDANGEIEYDNDSDGDRNGDDDGVEMTKQGNKENKIIDTPTEQEPEAAWLAFRAQSRPAQVPKESIVNPAGPFSPGFRHVSELEKEFETLSAEGFETDEDF